MPLFEMKPKLKPLKAAGKGANPFIQQGWFTEEELPIASKIQQRRLQMLVHSCIYYRMNTNLVTDYQFDKWGRELTELQQRYPDIASRVCYAEAFKDWDGTTGFHLPVDNWITNKAHQLLRLEGMF